MFDILVYFFENYAQSATCPEGRVLAVKLSAAGFDDDEIDEALIWLEGLRELRAAETPCGSVAATRIYHEREMARLDADCRGYIAFMEAEELLRPALREIVIDRALALAHIPVSLARLKIIMLMVLWSQDEALDALLLEELLSENSNTWVH